MTWWYFVDDRSQEEIREELRRQYYKINKMLPEWLMTDRQVINKMKKERGIK